MNEAAATQQQTNEDDEHDLAVLNGKAKARVIDLTAQEFESEMERKLHHAFYLTYETPSGEKLQGLFKCRRPSVGQISRIGVRKAQLALGVPSYSLDAIAASLHEWVAWCDIVLIEKPAWCDIDKCFEPFAFQAVYQEVQTFVESFHKHQLG